MTRSTRNRFMEDFKEKLYHYQAEPPADTWTRIAASLSHHQSFGATRMRGAASKAVHYSLTAAASFLVILMFAAIARISNKHADPPVAAASFLWVREPKMRESIRENNRQLQDIITAAKNKNGQARLYENIPGQSKKYLTVAGPEGQPVRISTKVATLIESADDKYPPRPVWNKKIERWKQIMLSSTISPTATDLMDVVQISAAGAPNQ
jgi:hypothetical protein